MKIYSILVRLKMSGPMLIALREECMVGQLKVSVVSYLQCLSELLSELTGDCYQANNIFLLA